jgi:cyclase
MCNHKQNIKVYAIVLLTICFYSSLFSQGDKNQISIESKLVSGNVHLLSCVNGFGGGNVAASVGEDGILLVDDMYVSMAEKLSARLQSMSEKPVRIVLNTHFHRDHIEGNKVLRMSTVIVAHENVRNQLIKNNKEQATTAEMMPLVTFTNRITIQFNGEEIQMIHFPNSHTDGDAAVYFTKSKVLHLGDMFFFGMFPAVYEKGGGDVEKLIKSLEKILIDFPADAKVIPGHGELATMKDLAEYVSMLKNSVLIVKKGIEQGKPLEQLRNEGVLAKYNELGEGGAQTTDQYLIMLYNLFAPQK